MKRWREMESVIDYIQADINGDKVIACLDCKKEFLWKKEEQEFYLERGFDAPKRCKACRRIRKEARRKNGAY